MDNNNFNGNSTKNKKSPDVDFYPLTSVALRRVRFVTNIIDKDRLYGKK